jgi:hypothetical protein
VTRWWTAVAALAAAVLAGCSDPPKSGEVTAKSYEAAYDYYTSICVSYGKYGCNVSMPLLNHEPEHWVFKVRDDADPEHVGKVEVNADIFNRYDIGSHWPDPR